MALELAKAYVQIVPSMQGVQGEIRRTFGDAGDQAGRVTGDRARGGILKGAVAAGAGFLGAFGLAGIAAGLASGLKDGIAGAVGYASDLNEAGTAVQAVFGKATDDINKFASAGAKGLGQSQLDVLNAAKSFGVYGKAAGLADSANAAFSSKLVGLSTDIASFYNVDPSQAAEAIAAGLRGESEPLRQYGILLDDATLKAEAMKQGTYSGTGTLSQQAKVLAAQAVILKQSSVAQGDFARTSGGLANQQRILSASVTDLKGKLGAVLLPIVTSAVTGLNKLITPVGALADRLPALGSAAKAGFGSVLQTIGPPVRAALSGIGAAFAPLGPVIVSAFAPLGPIFAQLVPQIVGLVTHISPIGLAFQALAPVLPVIVNLIGTLATTLGGLLSGVLSAVLPVIIQLSGILVDVGSKVLSIVVPAVAGLVTSLAGSLGSALTTILPVITSLATMLGDFLGSALTTLAPLLVSLGGLFATVETRLAPVIALIVKLAAGALAQLLPLFVQLVGSILPPVLALLARLVPVIIPIVNILGTVLTGVIKALLPVISAVFAAIVPIIKSALTIVMGVINVVLGLLTGNFTQVFQGLGQIVGGAFELVVNVIKGAVGIVGAAVKAVVDIVVTTFKGVVGVIATVAKNIIDGFVNGIKNGAQFVIDAARNLANLLPEWVRKVLNIHSPSRVMLELGRFVGAGFAKGVDGTQDQVKSAADKLVTSVTDAFSKLVANREAAQKRLAKLNTQLSRVDTSTKAGKQRASDLRGSIAEQQTAIAASKRPGGTKGFTAALKADTAVLVSLAGRRDRLADQLKTAQDKFTEAVKVRDDFRDSIRDTVVGLGDVFASYKSVFDARAKAAESVSGLQDKLGDLAKSQADANKDADTTRADLAKVNGELARLSGYGDDYADKVSDLQDKRTDLTGKLADQLGKVAEYTTQISAAQDDLGKAQADAVQASTPKVLDTLRAAVANTNTFRDTLAALRSQGIDDTTYTQLLQGGIANGGLQAAQELRAAGPGVVQEIAGLQQQLSDAGKALGTDTSTVLYQAGVDIAQNTVDGIKSKIVDNQAAIALLETAIASRLQLLGINTSALTKGAGAQVTKGLADGIYGARSDLDNVIDQLGERTVKRLKKKLGIKSPSRVVRTEVGRQVGAGFVLGIEDMHSAAERAASTLAAVPSAALAGTGLGELGVAPATVSQTFTGQVGYSPEQFADIAATKARRALAGASIPRVRVG